MTKDNRQFTWLGETSFPRRGPKLTKGELHKAVDYAPEVLEEWAKTGNLMFEDEVKKSTKGGKD